MAGAVSPDVKAHRFVEGCVVARTSGGIWGTILPVPLFPDQDRGLIMQHIFPRIIPGLF
jgi:hypothetical protein